ncbi:CidA/LrgA family protein [Niveibacterium sp. 24ML]|uniref:CidA/LrgA family protein n=1 Tax=Niveibacterium sp. 24ML TaxID=2985512 RepID=UPI00226DF485|nr:CidA/LrgA family protein [Niveibacterium sp. 24ML]MCX9155038.1 CidA/LrgA family protein [Niveibacterium sp. 24ML]
MLEGLFALLVFQLLGEACTRLLGLPIPGPVIGLLLLFVLLRARPQLIERLRPTAEMLHSHLALLFIPAGVGVVMFLPRLRQEWLPIVVALIVSTAVGLVVTAWVAHRLAPEDDEA